MIVCSTLSRFLWLAGCMNFCLGGGFVTFPYDYRKGVNLGLFGIAFIFIFIFKLKSYKLR